jgi:hypothetical protein
MMLDKKVYISGPTNQKLFQEAERKLKTAGFVVVNRLNLGLDKDMGVKDVALIHIAALGACNYIYQLDGWQDDDSATAEWFIAQWMGLLVVNESWLDWYVGELERRKEYEKESKEKNDQDTHQKT